MPSRDKLDFNIVAAVDGVGRLSDPTGAYVPPATLDPVDNLNVSANSTTEQTASWGWSDTGEDGFEHQYQVQGVDSSWRTATSLPDTARDITVTGLPSNTSIGHRVRAVSAAVNGPWSEVWQTTESDVGNPDPPDPGDFVYWKFGWDDFQVENPFVLQNSGTFGQENWGRWWGIYKRGGQIELPDGRTEIPMMENNVTDQFEYVYPTSFYPDSANFISSRPMKFRLRATMKVRAGNIPKTGTIYITIRYKDQVIPGKYAGTSIWTGIHDSLIGTIGGLNDHRWKTDQFEVQSQDMEWEGDNIVLSFGEEYADEHCGQINIDRMKISTTNNLHEFPADEPGMWHTLDVPNRHANIYSDHQWYRGETPVFRFGCFMQIGIELGPGGDRAVISTHEDDQFQTCEDAGMNVVIQHMYNTHLFDHWKTFPGENDIPGCLLVEGGAEEWSFHCDGHGMQYIPNTLTNIWPEQFQPNGGWGTNANHTEWMAEVDASLAQFQGDQRLLSYFFKDELDHDGTRDSYPIEACRMAYARAKNSDPDRPVFCSMMGFHWEKSWEWWGDIFDICGNDRYFVDGADGTWIRLESGIRDSAAKQMTARRIFKTSGKLLVNIPHMSEGASQLRHFPDGFRLPNQNEMVMQHYLGVCCGAKGSIFFRYDHPKKPDLQSAGIGAMWAGMAQIGDELFGAQGINDIIMAPSIELDIGDYQGPPQNPGQKMSEKGVVTTSSGDMHWIVQQTQAGQKYLIALNGLYSSRSISFGVNGVSDGSKTVRFEGRSVNVSSGVLTDTFGPWERHVYELGT